MKKIAGNIIILHMQVYQKSLGCHHFTHVCQKSQSYDVWFLRYGLRQTCFVILGHFLPFYPTNNPKK